MFKPKYTITNKILKALTEIAAAREIIANAVLIPKWEISLRSDALVRSAHASTSIEGNPLSLEDVTALSKGRKVMATRKSKEEVLSYLRVLRDIPSIGKKKQIHKKTILKIHKEITRNVLDKPEDCGKYREKQVVVGNRITGEVFFTPPPPAKVPALVSDFTEWLNSPSTNDLDPVLTAGIAHYELVRVHPFTDGNGRVARAVASLILYKKGFDIRRFFALDDYYDGNRGAYYDALQSVNQKTLDLTKWLEYFTEGVAISVVRVKDRVLQLSSEKLRKDRFGQIALTERQMRIVEHIYRAGRITSKDLQKLFNITRQAAHKEIKKLIRLKIIKPVGKGRASHYIMG